MSEARRWYQSEMDLNSGEMGRRTMYGCYRVRWEAMGKVGSMLEDVASYAQAFGLLLCGSRANSKQTRSLRAY